MNRTALLITWLCLAAPALAAEPFLEKTELFTSNTDGYALYRIPGLIVTSKGTVLAYCEARRSGKTDWDAIDIMLRRSTDGGKTWSPRQKISEVPGPHKKNPMATAQKLGNPDDVTYNNAVGFADRDGTVHFLFCLEYMRCFYIRSDDDGVTFSKPVEITATFEKFRSEYDWKIIATGPAHGIQLKTGRLVVPVWLSLGTGGHAHRPSVAATIYSDDHGRTWLAGDIALPNTDKFVIPNETVIVELSNGSVMLNSRSESTAHRRIVVTSPDGATGWGKPRFDDALLEPICMASIVRYTARPVGDKNRILFANPHNLSRLDGKEIEGKSRDRRNISIKVSYDEGKTWPVDKVLDPGYSAYSDLAVLPDGTILCLYESGRKSDEELKKSTSYAALTLARFNIEWVTDGKDTTPVPFDGKYSFNTQRDDLQIAGADGFVLHPTKPAADGSRPWVWYAPTIGRHPGPGNEWLLKQLLVRGFYVGGCNVGEVFANPTSREQYAAFYRYVVDKYKLSPKVVLIAQSRGGLFQYNFAADHPEWVAAIVGIFPVGDLRSFPTLERAAPAYGMTVAQLEAELAKHNPIDRLEKIAAAKIPILHVHGNADKIVPIEKNSQVIYDRYTQLGGSMKLIVVPDKGHENDPEFFESTKQLEFILKHGS